MIKKKICLVVIGITALCSSILFGCGAKEKEMENKFSIKKIAGFNSGVQNKDGGTTEIIKYNKDNNKFYVINGEKSKISIVSLNDLKNTDLKEESAINIKTLIKTKNFEYGDTTSIGINNNKKEIAIAIQEKNYNKEGIILILDYDGNLKKEYTVGVQPDMLKYTNDGNILLVANEGEPRLGYGKGVVDPKGSISIIDINKEEVYDADFTQFDSKKDELIKDRVILNNKTEVSKDFEPEYISIDSKGQFAYITLQESNAVAVLDINKKKIINVKSLGFKDHGLEGNEIDLTTDGKGNIIKRENVYGAYMPDGIEVYEKDGKTYILTGNEGDGREYTNEENEKIKKENDYTNIKKEKIDGEKVETIDKSMVSGLDEDKTYIFGSRSFSIFDASNMELVFDSGSDFEKKTLEKFPHYFNASNDSLEIDKRSGKKGSEPEDIKIGTIGDKTYAFIGLERISGIMIYDITNPQDSKFISYINDRDFSQDIGGDVSPEGLEFIEGTDKTNPMLLVSNEVSGTVAVYEITIK